MQPIYIHAHQVNVSSGAKSFSVLAYTGGTLRLRNFEAPVVVDLSKLQLGKSLIANLDHDKTKRVGHIPPEGVKNTGRELRLSGSLSAVTPYRDEVLASYREGFRWQASIEAEVEDYRLLDRGQRTQVNGRMIEGPVYLAVSTLRGFAFVSHGADDDTVVSIAASRDDGYRYSSSRYFPPPSIEVTRGGYIRYPTVQRV
jgi:hypothetical protein